VLAKMQTGDGELAVVQATVKVNIKQSLAVYKGGAIVSGDAEKATDVTEFIVLEKRLSDRDGEWKIAGRINRE
jgi:predicted lipid-binding transport protein (Tim44 family)